MSTPTIHNPGTTDNAGVPPAPPEAHQRAIPAPLRGLAIRADFALAKVMQASHVGVARDDLDLCCALADAQCLGYCDYLDGHDAVPVMFADEPDLVTAWESGQHFAVQAALESASLHD